MNTWSRLNKGVRRLIILGYAICLIVAVQTWRSIKSDEEVQEEIAQRSAEDIQKRQENWSDPFFTESNNRYRKKRTERAKEEANRALSANQDKRQRAMGLIIGYPLAVILFFWVSAGFKNN